MRIRRLLSRCLPFVALALPPLGAAAAQIRPPSAAPPAGPPVSAPAEPGSDLAVSLLTMGVGEQVWEQFGHNAIWIHVERPPSSGGPVDAVYHWGLFDSSQPYFIPRFLKGRMLYSMGGFDLGSTLQEYRARDRAVWAQELDLTALQKVALRDYIVWNAQPEHRDYYYDYYRDNCSTRVRDALDRALGGIIRATFSGRMTDQTNRSHTLRLTQVNPLLAAGIDVGLGRPADRPLSAYEEMFLPRKLHDYVRELRVTDERGTTRPLVKSERQLLPSQTHVEPLQPPHWTALFLTIGIVLGALFAVVGVRAARGNTAARYAAGALFALWALGAGILGTLLFLLWTFTHHTFAHQNENLLLFHPLWLALVVLAPMATLRGRFARATRALGALVAALAIVAILLHVVGLSRQANLDIIGLALPPIVALAWSVHRQTAPARGLSTR